MALVAFAAPALSAPAVALETVMSSLPSKLPLLNSLSSPDIFYEAAKASSTFSEWGAGAKGHSFIRLLDEASISQLSLSVEIRLVCFDGDGNQKFSIREDDLQAYVNSAVDSRTKGIYSITPARTRKSLFAAPTSPVSEDVFTGTEDHSELINALSSGSGSLSSAASDAVTGAVGANGLPLLASRVPVQHRMIYRVSKASQRLCQDYKAAVQAEVNAQVERINSLRGQMTSGGSGSASIASPDITQYSVPSTSVSAVLSKDRSSISRAYVIYITSPTTPAVRSHSRPAGDDMVPVKYTFTQRLRNQVLEELDPRRGATKPTCDHQVVLSPSVDAKEISTSAHSTQSPPRWALIDLTAGPVTMFPQASGEGAVTELSFPRVDRLMQRHQIESKPTQLSPATGSTPSPSLAGKKMVIDPRFKKMSDAEKKTLARADYDAKGHELIAGLSSVVNKLISGVIAPPLWKFPRLYARRVLINVFVISDEEGSERSFNQNNKNKGGKVGESKPLRQWREIAKRLESVAPEGQSIIVDVHTIPLATCPLCLTGFMRALRSHTDTREGSLDVMTSMGAQVSSYIDSAELGVWMRRFRDRFWAAGANDGANPAELAPATRVSTGSDGSSTEDVSPAETRVVDAFLFDLNSREVILLDRESQATSAPLNVVDTAAASSTSASSTYTSTVLGVQTASPSAPLDFVCNGALMQTDFSDASTALLGVLLSELYGIAPTPMQVNSAQVSDDPGAMPSPVGVEMNYLWAPAATPFGPFNAFVTASTAGYSPAIASPIPFHFGLRDAVGRNVLVTEISSSLAVIRDLRLRFAKFRAFFPDTAGPEKYEELVVRVTMLRTKLSKARELASAANFGTALFYARSARHDALAVERIVLEVMAKFRPSLSCGDSTGSINSRKEGEEKDEWEQSGLEGALESMSNLLGLNSGEKSQGQGGQGDEQSGKNKNFLEGATSSEAPKAKQRSAVRAQYEHEKSKGTKVGGDGVTIVADSVGTGVQYENNVQVINDASVRPSTLRRLLTLVLETAFVIVLVIVVAIVLFTDTCSCRKKTSANRNLHGHEDLSMDGMGINSGARFSSVSPRNNLNAYSNTFVPAQREKKGWFNLFGSKKKSSD